MDVSGVKQPVHLRFGASSAVSAAWGFLGIQGRGLRFRVLRFRVLRLRVLRLGFTGSGFTGSGL